jgi:outer membrane scaffolding protein for murein synthesis (MipA/OmpV family)
MKYKSLLLRVLTVALTSLVWHASPAVAQEGREFNVGAGALGGRVYPGSSDSYITPFPTVGVSHSRGSYTLGASLLDGLYLGYFNQQTGAGFLMLRPGLQPSWRR